MLEMEHMLPSIHVVSSSLLDMNHMVAQIYVRSLSVTCEYSCLERERSSR